VVFQNPSVGEAWCQLKSVLRFSAPCREWMKSLALADQALLVWLGRWHQAQVGESLRWPA